MRITNQNPTLVPSTDTPAGADTAAAAPRNDSTAAPTSPPASPSQSFPVNLVPSFELLSLTATLQQIPPVRADIIAETVRRLANAEFQTPSAIEQTARVMLGQK